jgi:hypothetical protein
MSKPSEQTGTLIKLDIMAILTGYGLAREQCRGDVERFVDDLLKRYVLTRRVGL